MTTIRLVPILCVFFIVGAAFVQTFLPMNDDLGGLHPSGILYLNVFRTVQILVVAAPLVLLPSWLILRLYVGTRPTKAGQELALTDPWVRAKLATMNEEERAAFLDQINK